MADASSDDGLELGAKPDADALEARVELAALRRMMFGRANEVQVGRHRLIELVGRGAHGSVFEAEDSELGRRIAVKVVLRNLADATTHEERLAEARAMARLNHPNVVTVYEAGVTEDRFWIAMELVRGSTLQAWADEHPVGARDHFEQARLLLEQAGRGLAAAHAAGLVHRDFKPGNVLLGEDGFAQVTDFGLARAWRQAGSQPEGEPTHSSLEDAQTSTALAGTPRYMSPEQLRRLRVDHRSDQFNFAVTAWELVYGRLPYEGSNFDELLVSMETGSPDLPSKSRVPRWYGRALRRALRPAPDRRFSSMDALLSALDPVSRNRRGAIATGVVVVGLTSIAAVAWTRAPPAEAVACDAGTARIELETVWNQSRSDRLVTALGDREWVPALLTGLERHAQRWTAQYVATCKARWEAKSIGDRDLDATMTCLRRSLDTMDATVGRLDSATPEVMARALGMVKELPEPLACEDPDEQSAGDPQTVRRLGRALAGAEADRTAGRYTEAAEAGVAIADDARAAGAELLAADALEIAGRAWGEQGDERRFEVLERAHGLATAAGSDRRATRIAVALSLQHTYSWRVEDGHRWLRHARAGLARRPDPELTLAARHAEGIWLLKQHKVKEALAVWEPLAEELATVRSSDSETTWLLRADLVLLYNAIGQRDRAVGLGRSLLRETQEDLGDGHPRVARVSSELARIEAIQGHDEVATVHAERAVAVSLGAYGPVSRRTAIAYVQLGLLQHRRGFLDDAKQSYLNALVACGDRRDEWRARAYRDLGRLYAEQGDYKEAADSLRRGVSVGRDVWAPERDELLDLRRIRAEVWIDLGQLEEAQSELRRILDVAKRVSNDAVVERVQAALARLTDVAPLGGTVPAGRR